MRRRNKVFATAAVFVVTTGIVTGMVVACRGDGSHEPTRTEYLARVAAICEAYGEQLDEIPPPSDPASPGAVFESISRALPILREQRDRVRALEAPEALRGPLDRFFTLTDRSLAALERAEREAGKRELFLMVQALADFETVRDEAKQVADVIGFDC